MDYRCCLAQRDVERRSSGREHTLSPGDCTPETRKRKRKRKNKTSLERTRKKEKEKEGKEKERGKEMVLKGGERQRDRQREKETKEGRKEGRRHVYIHRDR